MMLIWQALLLWVGLVIGVDVDQIDLDCVCRRHFFSTPQQTSSLTRFHAGAKELVQPC